MSEAKIRALLYCPDAYADGYSGYEDAFREVEGETIEELIADAVQCTPDEDENGTQKPSLWILDEALTARLTEALDQFRATKKDREDAVREMERQAREIKAEIDRNAKATDLRARIAALESGAELAKAKAELEAIEAAGGGA